MSIAEAIWAPISSLVAIKRAFELVSDIMLLTCSRQLSMSPLQGFRIWKRSDQKDPLELIGGWWVSHDGFWRLAKDSSVHLPAMENFLAVEVPTAYKAYHL